MLLVTRSGELVCTGSNRLDGEREREGVGWGGGKRENIIIMPICQFLSKDVLDVHVATLLIK